MSKKLLSALLLTAALPIMLAACAQNKQAATQTPVPLQPVAETAQLPVEGDIASRVARLEGDMAGLKTEMAMAKHDLQKINAIEAKFKELSFELSKIDSAYNLSPAPQPVVEVETPAELTPQKKPEFKKPEVKKTEVKKAEPKKPEVKKPEAAKAPVAAGKAEVSSIRIGSPKAGVTRIVLESGKKLDFRSDIDNAEKLLVLETSGGSSAVPAGLGGNGTALVKSYQGNGASAVFQLKESAKIVGSGYVDAGNVKSGKYYIDLVPAKD